MKSDFYMTLPSNSSMRYFPENTTSHFQTKLPHEWRLTGDWVVGLCEIQFPQTFSHIPMNNHVTMSNITTSENGKKSSTQSTDKIIWGIYNNISEVLVEVNKTSSIEDHLKFHREIGGHIIIRKICHCQDVKHHVTLHPVFWKIMGFGNVAKNTMSVEVYVESEHPASLSSALPSVMFVYSDLCDTQVSGDVQTPLLAVVPVESNKFDYGSMRLRTFPVPKYVKLLKTNFETIEIDIRDETGKFIPFDYGTLTVTLHFKRVD